MTPEQVQQAYDLLNERDAFTSYWKRHNDKRIREIYDVLIDTINKKLIELGVKV